MTGLAGGCASRGAGTLAGPLASHDATTPLGIFGSLLHEDMIAIADYITLNGSNVSGWSGSRGQFGVTQSTPSKQALWVADGPGDVSGEIDFDGIDDELLDNTPTGIGNQADYICAMAVVKFDDLTGNADPWGGEYAWAVYDNAHLDAGLAVMNTGDWRLRNDVDDGGPGVADTATESSNDTSWHAHDLVMLSTGHKGLVDNVEYSTQFTQSAGLSAAWVTDGLRIGCVAGGSDGYADCHVARLTWLKGGDTSDAQRARWWQVRRDHYSL